MIKRRIYISGKITGVENWKDNFIKAEKFLKKTGAYDEIINPLNIQPEKLAGDNSSCFAWNDYMRADIKQLVDCTYIYMLKGWKKSKGAKLEHELAKKLGIIVFYEQ